MCTCCRRLRPHLNPTICVYLRERTLRLQAQMGICALLSKGAHLGTRELELASLAPQRGCPAHSGPVSCRVQVSSGQLASDAGVQAVKPQVCYYEGSCRKHSLQTMDATALDIR